MRPESADTPSSTRARIPALVLGLLLIAGPAYTQAPDSLRFRIEAGGSADYTNERFYETFDDSTFRREAVDSPERRYAGVLLFALDGTRQGGATTFQMLQELSLGDRLTRDALGLLWRSDFTPEDRLTLDPRLEYRRDRTLDRDLEEFRANAGIRYRRQFLESSRSLHLGLRGESVRSSGAGSEFVLDRDAGVASAAIEQLGLDGLEWRAGYQLAARMFPDSALRDHFEHAWEARLRSAPVASWSWQLESTGERRVTMDPAPTSRDNFWQGRTALEVERRGEGPWGFRGRMEGEALHYEVADSTLYFDYQTLRLTAGPRWGGLATWTLWLSPRVEALFAADNPGEEYLESALALEVEGLFHGTWWSLVPAAGWRAYGDDPIAAQQGLDSPRSSYGFLELGAFGDQALPGNLRLRCLANARLESHDDDSQDASSLYFSLDLRKIF